MRKFRATLGRMLNMSMGELIIIIYQVEKHEITFSEWCLTQIMRHYQWLLYLIVIPSPLKMKSMYELTNE